MARAEMLNRNSQRNRDKPLSDAALFLVDDLLRGVSQIAKFLNINARRALYLCERGYIPVGKEGAVWIASRQVLTEHYQQMTRGEIRPASAPRVKSQRSSLQKRKQAATSARSELQSLAAAPGEPSAETPSPIATPEPLQANGRAVHSRPLVNSRLEYDAQLRVWRRIQGALA